MKIISHFYLKNFRLKNCFVFIEKLYLSWTVCLWRLLVFMIFVFLFSNTLYKSSLLRVVILLFVVMQVLSHLSLILTFGIVWCAVFKRFFLEWSLNYMDCLLTFLWMLKPSPLPKLYKYLPAFPNNVKQLRDYWYI